MGVEGGEVTLGCLKEIYRPRVVIKFPDTPCTHYGYSPTASITWVLSEAGIGPVIAWGDITMYSTAFQPLMQ